MALNSAFSNVALSCAMLLLSVGFVSSNIDQDKAECADQVVGLATCLPYVSGDAKAPTPDCCTGLKLVLQKSKKCLCVLIKDRDDPTLGLKIILPLALGLPDVCHSPTDIKECIGLLHLSPNSTAAKDFLGLNGKQTNITAAPAVSGNSTQNPQEKNDGGIMRSKQWFGIEILIWFFISFLTLNCIW